MDRLTEAFKDINRVHFLPKQEAINKDVDAPLPIGFGQTNSQPSTVRQMLEWLDPHPGNKVMDVGSGSGWTSALLAYLIRPGGHVYAVEIIPELVRFGRENCNSIGLMNISFYQAHEDHYGLPEYAPYDRILVSAEADEVPNDLLRQLNVHGKLVIPVLNTIEVIEKLSEDHYSIEKHPGYIFVPLVRASLLSRY